MHEFLVCAACLATDVRMFSMSATSLLETYQLLTRRQINDNMPQKLCWECTALVHKFSLFRHKCEKAYLLLQDIYNQHDEITENKVKKIDRMKNLLTSTLNFSKQTSTVIDKRKGMSKSLKKKDFFENVTIHEGIEPTKTEVDVKQEICETKFEDPIDDVLENEESGCDMMNEESKPTHSTHLGKSHRTKCKVPKEKNFNICSTCGKTFKCALSLKEHQSVHTNVANYKCEYCSKTFVYRRSYWRHSKTHVNTRAFVCDICGKRFKTSKVLKDHRLAHRESRDFKCNICPKNYTTYKALWLHSKKCHSKNRPYECDICNMSFSLKSELTRHLLKRKNHKDAGQMSTRCVVCDTLFATRGELLDHRAACRTLSAAPSKSEIGSSADLIPNPTLKGQRARPYKCKICDRSFTQYCSLTLHINTTHSEERPYVCEVCGKAFKVKDGLKRHLQVHTGEKLYKCDICEKSFASNSWRKQHIRRAHLNDQTPYKPRVKGKQTDL